MRTLSKIAFVSLFAAFAMACNDRAANRPASHPMPQEPNDPIADNHNPPQAPLESAGPQAPTLQTQGPTQPINDPEPQRPLLGTGGSTSLTSAEVSSAPADKPLSDAEVLGVAEAANNGEVDMAELALKKASSPDVKQFAATMKMHHSAYAAKEKTIETETKLKAADNAVAEQIKSETASACNELRTKEGKEFDRAYLDAQVKAHKDVLTAIDNRIMPSVQNGQVKTMVTELRKRVAAHLAKADELAKKTR